MDTIDINDIIILRCCRDWPVHAHTAYNTNGKCGLCHDFPIVVWEKYQEKKFTRDENSQL